MSRLTVPDRGDRLSLRSWWAVQYGRPWHIALCRWLRLASRRFSE